MTFAEIHKLNQKISFIENIGFNVFHFFNITFSEIREKNLLSSLNFKR